MVNTCIPQPLLAWPGPKVPPRPAACLPVPFVEPELHTSVHYLPILLRSEEGMAPREAEAYVCRGTDDVEQAYQRVPQRFVVFLPRNKGEIFVARVLRRVHECVTRPMLFQETNEFVTIKRLNLCVIQQDLDQGGAENPYNEISVMQQHGDDVHIVKCIEALKDKKYLHIVMPYFQHMNFSETIIWCQKDVAFGAGYRGSTPIRTVMQKLVENILYLQQHGLINRSLSLEKLMVDDTKSNYPMVNLSTSLRLPLIDGQASNVHANEKCGKDHYMPPEVAYQQAFSNQIGESCNVWILGAIFFNMLTGLHLYDNTEDQCFIYLVECGLINDEFNLRCLKVLDQGHPMIRRIQAIQLMPRNARDLIHRMMRCFPENRIRPEEILVHSWFTAANDNGC